MGLHERDHNVRFAETTSAGQCAVCRDPKLERQESDMGSMSWDAAATPAALLYLAMPLVASLGFEYLSYTLNTSLPVSSPRSFAVNNLPPAWQDSHAERLASGPNPILQLCRSTVRPVVWNDTSFNDAPVFQAAIRKIGVRSGWSQLARDSNGGWGLLTLSRTTSCVPEADPWDVEARFVWLTQVFHHHMSRICRPRHLATTSIMLTEVEKTIIRWTIDGKTSAQLAEILRVSERTVNFHVQNVMAKLNTCNKTAAAAQAALLGLLH
ncbi:autoinducer binding domain-containing protein [Burkholderia vietnamiensis]|uniref:autoinducer binding domain-containing protein n=1 Tax=Burkholderia vietnamiensis TaxID=60552 RepID=UPI0015944770|nr:autoinducer binding domain-containing protein [Burkholderia vietnamiensis]